MAKKVSAVKKRVSRLVPGMKLARSAHSREGTRLFDKDVELTGSDIDKLKKWKVRFVYIYPED